MAKKRKVERKAAKPKRASVAPRVIPAGLTIVNGPTIEAGDSLSGVGDCSMGRLIRITMPTDWTGDTITFQISTDGLGYNDVFRADGSEATVKCFAGTALLIPDLLGDAACYIKIRSGTRDRPVVQPEIRTFAMTVKT